MPDRKINIIDVRFTGIRTIRVPKSIAISLCEKLSGDPGVSSSYAKLRSTAVINPFLACSNRCFLARSTMGVYWPSGDVAGRRVTWSTSGSAR